MRRMTQYNDIFICICGVLNNAVYTLDGLVFWHGELGFNELKECRQNKILNTLYNLDLDEFYPDLDLIYTS